MQIREVAERLQMTPRAIRFYEEKGLLTPAKHPENGYRTFTEEDVWRLSAISALREVGMKVEDIGSLLSGLEGREPVPMSRWLELQRSALFAHWVEVREMLLTLDRMIGLPDGQQAETFRELAGALRKLKEARRMWVDRWSFDRLSEEADAGTPLEAHAAGDGTLGGHLPDPRTHRQALQAAVRLLAPTAGESGLDVGAGTGSLTAELANQGARMTAVDQSRRMLELCARSCPEAAVKLGNFLAIPCFDGQFDFAATSFALHHLTGEQKLLALAEMDRTLKPRGRLCIVDYMHGAAPGRTAPPPDEHYADPDALVDELRQRGYAAVWQPAAPGEPIFVLYAVRTY
jgi:putative AdoMet-dependent methyltransferase